MKKYITIFLYTLFYLSLHGQNEFTPKWLISTSYAMHDADDRLFNFPEFPKRALLARQPEKTKTYQLSLSLNRKILSKNRLTLYGGVGLSSEMSNFIRPFDHGYGRDALRADILLFSHNYYQHLIQLPVQSRFRFLKRWSVSLEVLPQFNFLTVAQTNGFGNISWWRFDFYSVEFNPGLTWTSKRFDIGLNYRAFQLKTIDRILFSYFTLNDAREGETFETYNLFKLWFSMGFKF